MGEWKKLSADEWQQIFYDRKKWNLGHKKISDNGRQPPTNKTDTNLQIKQLQDSLDASKNRLTSFPYTSEKSDGNYFDPTDSIMGIKSKKQKCESK